MTYLLDTNVFLRWSDSRAPEHDACIEAVNTVASESSVICICAQVLIECYAVATRPLSVNGLGYSSLQAQQMLIEAETSFPCLPEPPDMARRWRNVVSQYSVIGKQAHDARIVAVMQAHGVDRILTLNVADFTRYQGITPISPSDVLSP